MESPTKTYLTAACSFFTEAVSITPSPKRKMSFTSASLEGTPSPVSPPKFQKTNETPFSPVRGESFSSPSVEENENFLFGRSSSLSRTRESVEDESKKRFKTKSDALKSRLIEMTSPHTPQQLILGTPMRTYTGSFGRVDIFDSPNQSSPAVAVKTEYVLKPGMNETVLPVGMKPVTEKQLEREIKSLSEGRPGCVPFIGATVNENEKCFEIIQVTAAGVPLVEELQQNPENRLKRAEQFRKCVKMSQMNGTKHADPKLDNAILIGDDVFLVDIEFKENPNVSCKYFVGKDELSYKASVWIACQEIEHYGEWLNYDQFMKELRDKARLMSEEELKDY